ncbi:hypothetical protein [Clostridioides sp. ZZV14-6345]|uniref:hypothetical protein n=1 Tax=Clostridioides sp. ZZV14-6345 TaxID=2811496 RepID=UPI001D101A07|nr:hypothetical protein [Clostridioides sp. ZZV14-6345]
MFKIEVGKKLEANAQEGLNISFDESGFIVVFKLSNLSDKEITGFKTGNLRIDVAFLEKIIFFVFTNTSGIGDADIPFSFNLSKVKEIAEIGENQGLAMNLILVEANNNIVKGLRHVGLNTNTSKYIKKCRMEQLDNNFDRNKYVMTINKLQRNFNSRDIKKMAGAYSSFKTE